MAPDALHEILQYARVTGNMQSLLVGNNTSDDAAVLRLSQDMCLISTADFFMPVVDDAFDFGAIAAANALSDVYAMGGNPVLAIAILGWPLESLGTALAAEVLRGARSVCEAAQVPLAGGHTIDSKEPFFGLAVNGLVNEKHIKRNHTVQAGDMLFLTKPIGSGIISTAHKRALITDDVLQIAINTMKQVNNIGALVSAYPFVHAITDVTGFGLIGHLLEMISPSNLSAEVYYRKLHFLPESVRLASQFVYADNTMRNWKSFAEKVEGINGESLITLCDPQTSGGLLIAVDKEHVSTFAGLLSQHQLGMHAEPIACITEPLHKPILINYQ